MTRAEKVAEAQRLRAQGLLLREIAEQMGAKTTTVHTWLNDPDLSKQRARRRTYAGECEECGAPTDGSNGPSNPAKLCNACATEPWWTRERIIEAIRKWAAATGRAPSQIDWNVWDRRHRHLPTHDEEYWPCHTTVSKRFGSWTAAIDAAGIEPRGRRDIHRFAEADWDAIAARIRDGEHPDDIALEFGTYGANLRQALYTRGYLITAIRAAA